MSERLFQRIHPDDPRAVAQRIQFGAEVLGETYTRLQQAEQKALEPWDVDLGECERAILDLNRVDDINEQLPWLIEGALNKIHRAVDHGILPVSHERVDHRLENMIVLVEPGRVGKDGSILYGGYNSSGELIYLLSDTRPGDEEHVLVHEALHQLSGRTYLEIRKNGGSIYKPQRVGLNVIPSLGLRYERLWEYPRNHTPQKNRFRWLNEAVTEDLSTQVMDETDSDIYPLHRKLYELVQTRGMFQLDSDLFSRAYFEESDPGLPSDERNEHWHTLMSAINLAYPLEWERPDGTVRKCNLLVVLDDIVLEHGIEGAIDAMANVQYKTEGSFRAKID